MFFIIILYREKIGVEFIMSTGRLQINVFEETFGSANFGIEIAGKYFRRSNN